MISFNLFFCASSKSVDHKRMARCLVQELETLLQISGINQINSIFFGGGNKEEKMLLIKGCTIPSIDI